ncbi:MAG: dipicolinate synthase subunit B [Oscillospiraceae bacterium]|nr:dipicolinate synthase subunit B [Oscillospiraceae bacterium]MCD7793153.1 dipicolinate synthase subunit B [Oscillospiraceae bacterium]MCD8099611.1 dipicolinate synthase subunit B [Oscillospiraceae bacterium]MCD8191352.1 dipicolinate synthase subunit B [Oscillospiraceae bacterium]MCD8255285.1 dipicolinate synthase subunit B [Oscillospiraceae bacterium]
MSKKRVGLAMTGSYCTYERALDAFSRLAADYDLVPIMSDTASQTDSRFGSAESFKKRLEALTGRPVIDTVTGAEPIGPQGLLDLLLIAPCTGNTLAKLALGITDSAVLMAAKSHLRNGRPVLIAVSSNDGLSGSAQNIGALLNRRNIYFVPFYQDDPQRKPRSLAARYDRLGEAAEAALEGRQLQPILAAD